MEQTLPAKKAVGKLVVAYRWSALDQPDVLVSSAHKTTRRVMTCTALKAT